MVALAPDPACFGCFAIFAHSRQMVPSMSGGTEASKMRSGEQGSERS
jgi:hypothetical protein